MRSHFLPILFALCCTAALLVAQDDGGAPPQLQAAIEALAKVDRTDNVAYGGAVRRVAGFAHARASEVLLAELERADGDYAKETVLRAIGQRPRPEAFEPLRQLLLDDRGSDRVRRAAAEAVGRQGDRGVDLLLEIADGRPSPAMRDACIEGLGAARDERAWRGLAALAAAATAPQQLRILRLCDQVHDVAALTRARELALEDRDPQLAALAFRQLAEERWPRTRDAVDELLDRLGAEPLSAARAELLRGLAPVLDERLYESFLRLAAGDATVVAQALHKVAADVAKAPQFVRWLCSEGLERQQPAEREAAMRLLRAAPPAAVAEPLAAVRARLRKPDQQALELALGLHELLRADPGWKTDVLQLARAKDASTRTAGLTLLLELNDGGALEIAQQSLAAREWELRSIAIRYLGQLRDLSSIPLLIARVGKEQGRLEQELSDSLFLLTGRRFYERPAWDRWWQKGKADFTLPPLQSVIAGASGKGAGNTISYYDIPLVSNRVAFLLDTSGSMNAQVGTDRKYTRLDEAKLQLRRVVEALPESFHCNLVIYESSVRAVWERLQRARAKAKAELLAAIAELKPTGGTNIHDALELAFRDAEVDTIYLLSDGQPSAGKITDVQDLADQVQRWNRTRQIVIHGIAIGMDSPLLKRLAAESGGSYVFRR